MSPFPGLSFSQIQTLQKPRGTITFPPMVNRGFMATGHSPRTALRPDTRLCVDSRRLHEPALPLPPHGLPAPAPTGASQFLLCFHNLPGVPGATSPFWSQVLHRSLYYGERELCVISRTSFSSRTTHTLAGWDASTHGLAQRSSAEPTRLPFREKPLSFPTTNTCGPARVREMMQPLVCVLRTGVLRCPAPGLPSHCGALWATAALSQNSSR